MKKYFIATVLLLISPTLFSQDAKKDYHGGYIKYEGAANPGEITASCTGFGKTKLESNKNAVKELFTTFLFVGISGSIYHQPVITDDGKRNHPAVVNLIESISQQYIIEDITTGTEKKRKNTNGVKGILTYHKITINCEAIIRHLTTKGVIKKFGY
jgi:hypothetical protein